jgi:hypothetical protein
VSLEPVSSSGSRHLVRPMLIDDQGFWPSVEAATIRRSDEKSMRTRLGSRRLLHCGATCQTDDAGCHPYLPQGPHDDERDASGRHL